jgi:hypothetical protein
MNAKEMNCEFQALLGDRPCGAPAKHEVVWYLWPFENMKADEYGNAVPKWVWLCEKHYQDLQHFHKTYPPTHELTDEDGPLTCTSEVPIGVSIQDVTVGRSRVN